MSRSVFITGVAGFIGSAVARRLLEHGDRVAGVDNLDPFYDPAFKRDNLRWLEQAGGVDFHEGDIRDEAGMRRWVGEAGAAHVIHMAALAGVRPSIADPVRYADVNVRGTEIVFQAAREAGVHRVVLASSSSVYGNNEKVPFSEDDPVDLPISPYAATKRANEIQAACFHHLTGIHVPCLRFFTVYGPRQRPEMAIRLFSGQIWRGEPVRIFGDGSMRRDFTYIDDIVDGVLAALDKAEGCRIYNLGEATTLDLLELVDALETALGKQAVRAHAEVPAGDVRITFADISRAQAELGYAPSIPPSEGLRRFADWFLREAPEGPRQGG
ncbi:MAG: GDP-mannose 4,6-dehydratase [Planctomycetota bacterium]|nr:GDP-mannose 4,6-dehydratase [Planctomycetota bacterium]